MRDGLAKDGTIAADLQTFWRRREGGHAESCETHVGSLVALTVSAESPAAAQSAPPFGYWIGEASGDGIYLAQDGSCTVSGSVNVAGTCQWQASYTGGILTMTYPWVIAPGHLFWNIRYLSGNQMLVNQVEKFDRR
jgi:hypothetical protein